MKKRPSINAAKGWQGNAAAAGLIRLNSDEDRQYAETTGSNGFFGQTLEYIATGGKNITLRFDARMSGETPGEVKIEFYYLP